jgi:transcriptional repressor NrdR
MRCPFCHDLEDKVVDTRPSDNDTVIRRRRECIRCSRRFTTYERIDEILPLVVKKDGRREPFDRAKILSGLKKACSKRPVPLERLEKSVDHIERLLEESGQKEIPSTRIGDAVMNELRELDDVAYVRFASVYRSFRDAAELMNELRAFIATREEGGGEGPTVSGEGPGAARGETGTRAQGGGRGGTNETVRSGGSEGSEP